MLPVSPSIVTAMGKINAAVTKFTLNEEYTSSETLSASGDALLSSTYMAAQLNALVSQTSLTATIGTYSTAAEISSSGKFTDFLKHHDKHSLPALHDNTFPTIDLSFE